MAKTSISLRVHSVVGASYVPNGKAIQVGFNTHLHGGEENSGGIVATSDAMLTIREAEQLLEQLTETLAEVKAEALALA
jgi:hypothetical protein